MAPYLIVGGGKKQTNIILKHQTLFKLSCLCLCSKSSSLKINFQAILTLKKYNKYKTNLCCLSSLSIFIWCYRIGISKRLN